MYKSVPFKYNFFYIENMSQEQIVVQDNKLIEMNPTEIVKISVGELTAPVQLKMYFMTYLLIQKEMKKQIS